MQINVVWFSWRTTGILGEIWTALESITTAFGDAAEVRGATLLGAGRPDSARLSAHKSLLMGLGGATFASVVVYLLSSRIPRWITDDIVLQVMVQSLLPLMAIGNLTLALGNMSFQLVGAQARYSLATVVQFIGSWIVTLPLAVSAVTILEWNLQSLVASVVIGYMVSGTLNFVILCSTNWERRSAKIQAKNEKLAALDGDSDSDLDDEEEERDGILMTSANMMTKVGSNISQTQPQVVAETPATDPSSTSS